MINLDITMFIQLINFLVALVVLNWLLIRPVREMLRRRRETTALLADEVTSFAAQAENALARYEGELRSAHENAAGERNTARMEAEAAEQALLADATREAHGTLHAAHVAMRQELDVVRQAVRGDMQVFSREAVKKLLA